ncbi:expressed unknown protein [Seminavis robusta]|uniref:Uncharacterized protein n=1 Tax=Seminavis robusta TaxID=568900 RepID=A0A9N8DS28_9STRA|nr:expressed unknown protein [Seminavis robusta]|eukprot:Sro213_g088330.1 n/a (283) ;mRNA; r:13936-14784
MIKNEDRLPHLFHALRASTKNCMQRTVTAPAIGGSTKINRSSSINKKNLRKSNKIRSSQIQEPSIDAGIIVDPNSSMAVLDSLKKRLDEVAANKSITRIKLSNFVDLHSEHPCALVALRDLLWQDSRSWSTLTFYDTIAGGNYRHWLRRKANIKTRLSCIQQDLGLQIVFRSRLVLDCHDETADRMVAVLRAVQKDPHVTSIYLTGYLPPAQMEQVCEALCQLMKYGQPRVWEGIVVHTTFTANSSGSNDDYLPWSKAAQKQKRYLEDLAIKCSIPVGVKVE